MPLCSILFLDDKPLYSILCAHFLPSSSIVYYIYLSLTFLCLHFLDLKGKKSKKLM